MKQLSAYSVIFTILMFSSCMHEGIGGCPAPELRVALEVADKNYENIADHSFITPLPENLPFKDYIQDLSHSLINIKTGEVFNSGTTLVESDDHLYNLLFKTIPQGEYHLTVLGNTPTETRPNTDDYDIYNFSGKITIPSNDPVSITRYMSRTKGLLYISVTKFPRIVTDVRFTISGLSDEQATPNASKAATPFVRDFPVTNYAFSEFQWRLPPSSSEGFQMSIAVFRGGTQIAIKDNIPVSIVRNRITAYNMSYDPINGELILEIWTNDQWERIHDMSINLI